ncbi:MAG TPA: ATP-binding cassette domain-containing protein [Acidimicrobiales bacterium]|nr:ATP-binding cassette domain-containing protein [Acidimicrobiales bacterium]
MSLPPGLLGGLTGLASDPEARRDAESRVGRWAAVTGLVALVWTLASTLLPGGLPVGVVLLGLVLGGLSSLTAMGLVLVYRSSRIINFAQAEIGGLAAAVAVVMVAGWRLPYFAALPVGLLAAVLTGALIDATVVRKFFTAPRLILTVATIGLAQVLGSAEIGLPTVFAHLQPLTTFKTPFRFTFRVGPLVFSGDHVVAMCVVPVALLGLAWFFSRSDLGIAVRGAADSNERALLLGIPVRRLSRITWVMAAGLSGLGAMLSAPILGPNLGVVAGPESLLAPLAAAVIARMESLPVAVGASLGIGVFQQAVFWSYPRSSTVDVALFAMVLIALLAQRRRVTRTDDSGLGGYVAVKEVRAIPAALARLPEVRSARVFGWLALAVVALVVPLALSQARLTLATYIAIYGILAVSLVVLTGWAGQISLGQFAFAGVGAAATATLLVHAHADFFVALLVAAMVGAGVAVAVGIPALRIPGLFLAVTTLAFAVPVSTYLLNSAYFPSLTPAQLARPLVLDRFDLDSTRVFYYFCLGALVVCCLLARNFRRTRAGRVVVAVRDNARGAAAFSISAVRAKLTAFAFSGALAGVAGGLYVVGLRGVPFSGFNPLASLQVFTMVVIGGLGSLPGALLGAIYVEGVQAYLRGGAQLFATGTGLLGLLMMAPGGLGEVVYGLRDRALRALARSKGLSVPSLAETAAFEPRDGTAPDGTADHAEPGAIASMAADGGAVGARAEDTRRESPGGVPGRSGQLPGAALLTCTGIDAAYGQVQVLFGVDLAVAEGEVLALLGTNGAGKSTILRVAAGLLRPSSGRVIFDGADVTKADPVQRVKAGLVCVPGGRGVFASLTVAENLRLAGWLTRRDRAFMDETTWRVLELFPVLGERLSAKASSLSGGEQQMLTLAQVLFCRPRLIMIDELSLGLAPSVVSTLLGVVRAIAESGTTIVLVEQSVNLATSLAERAAFMERGQVRFAGATAELTERPDLLRSVFLGQVSADRRPRRTPPEGEEAAGPDEVPPAALEVAGMAKAYGGVSAVSGVDLYLTQGEILGIIGSNGAGKTTLFDLCSGFTVADAGRIYLAGEDLTDLDPAGRAERGLGRMFQDARLFPSLTVAETLAVARERPVAVGDPVACALRIGAVVDSETAVAERVDELIESMGLSRYRDAFVSELSTGTRRVVELACALAHEPSVLLLDEPSSGIAQRETEALGELLLQVREQTGAAFVIIEHDVPLVSSISDRLVCMHLGGIIAAGEPGAVLSDPGVISSYLGDSPESIARSGRVAGGQSRPARRPPHSTAGPGGRPDEMAGTQSGGGWRGS